MTGDILIEAFEGRVRLKCAAIGPGSIELDAASVMRLVEGLASIAQHIEPAPERFRPGGPYQVENDPAWYVESEALTGDPLFHVRDPHFGWRHYLLPRGEAAALGTLLSTVASAPSPHQGQKPS